jgi:hypothetical protein
VRPIRHLPGACIRDPGVLSMSQSHIVSTCTEGSSRARVCRSSALHARTALAISVLGQGVSEPSEPLTGRRGFHFTDNSNRLALCIFLAMHSPRVWCQSQFTSEVRLLRPVRHMPRYTGGLNADGRSALSAGSITEAVRSFATTNIRRRESPYPALPCYIVFT